MIKKSIECWLIRSDEAVLLLRVPRWEGTNGAFWQFITGGIEDNETPTEAAVREIREETGLDIDAGELAIVAEDFRVEVSPELTISKTIFLARVTPHEITLNPLEHEAHQWAATVYIRHCRGRPRTRPASATVNPTPSRHKPRCPVLGWNHKDYPPADSAAPVPHASWRNY